MKVGEEEGEKRNEGRMEEGRGEETERRMAVGKEGGRLGRRRERTGTNRGGGRMEGGWRMEGGRLPWNTFMHNKHILLFLAKISIAFFVCVVCTELMWLQMHNRRSVTAGPVVTICRTALKNQHVPQLFDPRLLPLLLSLFYPSPFHPRHPTWIVFKILISSSKLTSCKILKKS
jgi:hypothetical protein